MSANEEEVNAPEEEIDWEVELQRDPRADDDAMNRKLGLPLTIWKDYTYEEKQAIYEENQKKWNAFYDRQGPDDGSLEVAQDASRKLGGA